jgi:large subunit ribosomal protein L5
MPGSEMRDIRLEKVVINIGIGSDENKFANAKELIKKLTNRAAVPTKSKQREPSLGLKRGQVIGAMATVRGRAAKDLLAKTLDANNNKLKASCIRPNSISFGIREYIDINGVKYDSKIGMLGMNINATFSRKGKRVELRKRLRSRVPNSHKVIEIEELIEYIKKGFGASLLEE